MYVCVWMVTDGHMCMEGDMCVHMCVVVHSGAYVASCALIADISQIYSDFDWCARIRQKKLDKLSSSCYNSYVG